ncbi:MAG: FtsW/RodA/SpoVE family cell cycle protein [Planctomycetota bacterium]|jgi:cell division protein FtsW
MLRPGQGVVLATLALLIVGVIMVNSVWLARSVGESAAALADDPAAGPITAANLLWGRPTLYALLAVLALVSGMFLPLRLIGGGRADACAVLPGGPVASARPPAALVALAISMLALLAAVYLPGIGREVNGASRWVEIGGFNFQPSEIAKWAMPVLVAWWCVASGPRIREFRRGFVPPMFALLLVAGIVGVEDLGTAVLILGVGVVVLAIAGVKLRHLALLIPVGGGAVAAAILHSPYRIQRLLAWRDPFEDPQGIGYHIIQSLSAIAGGGIAGRGLGQGIQKFGYLPEATTDFVFAIVCEELGLAGAAIVVALLVALLWSGMAIIAPSDARLRPPAFHRLLGLGILLTIGFQALMNVLVVTGLAPTKGIALPLVSHGGTGWVLTAFSLGILISIERTARSAAENESEPPRIAASPLLDAVA